MTLIDNPSMSTQYSNLLSFSLFCRRTIKTKSLFVFHETLEPDRFTDTVTENWNKYIFTFFCLINML